MGRPVASSTTTGRISSPRVGIDQHDAALAVGPSTSRCPSATSPRARPRRRGPCRSAGTRSAAAAPRTAPSSSRPSATRRSRRRRARRAGSRATSLEVLEAAASENASRSTSGVHQSPMRSVVRAIGHGQRRSGCVASRARPRRRRRARACATGVPASQSRSSRRRQLVRRDAVDDAAGRRRRGSRGRGRSAASTWPGPAGVSVTSTAAIDARRAWW